MKTILWEASRSRPASSGRPGPKTSHSRKAACLWFGLTVTCLCPVHQAPSQSVYSQVYSFGFTNLMGDTPCGLIDGSDGVLYGATAGGGLFNAGMVFRMNEDGNAFTRLHSFHEAGSDGHNPAAPPIEGSDGALFGTTTNGGAAGWGTVFRLNKDGAGYEVLHHFTGGDEARPLAALLEGADGALYGTAAGAASENSGVVFKLNRDGTGHAVLRRFSASGSDGRCPAGALVEGTNGMLYGTTPEGGSAGFGTLFRMQKDGSGYGVLWSFGATSGDGRIPRAGLIVGSDGALFGTTFQGGALGRGTVFRLGHDGILYTVLRSFQTAGFDGRRAENPLVEGADGMLYGTTQSGGMLAGGVIFKLSKDGTDYSVIHSFMGSPDDGRKAAGALVSSGEGRLFGATLAGGSGGGGAVFTLQNDGTAYTVLRDFNPSGGDAQSPAAAVVAGQEGVLYGCTAGGGAAGLGAIFRVNSDGSGHEILHSLSWAAENGRSPSGPMLAASDGALYGATVRGGTNVYGTLFKLNKDGTGYAVLRAFGTATNDGHYPLGLLEGSGGWLYGITEGGGNAGVGTVYKLRKTGNEYAILHHFEGGSSDGASPVGSLIEGSDGALYGATYEGGSKDDLGALFKLNKDGSGFGLLYSFRRGDLAYPLAGLMIASDGWLYGTSSGEMLDDGGAVFKLQEDGTGFAVIRTFTGTGGDGAWPEAPLVEGNDGALYGTTPAGGAYGFGTIFKLNRDGSDYSVVWSFQSAAGDGQRPRAGMALGRDGALYGTTTAGGNVGLGTVCRFGPAQPNQLSLLRAPGGVQVRFGGIPDRTYELQRSVDLNSWETLVTPTAPLLPFLLYEDSLPPLGKAFYRTVLR